MVKRNKEILREIKEQKQKEIKKLLAEAKKPSKNLIIQRELFDKDGNKEIVREVSENAGVYNKSNHKLFLEKERYKLMGRKDKNKHFVQCSENYQQNVVGKYSPKMLEALMMLVPYLNYKGKVIKIDGKHANLYDIKDLLGISKQTTINYLSVFEKDGILESIPSGVKNENNYISKSDVLFKGENKSEQFTKKIVQAEMLKVIKSVKDQMNSRKDKTKTNSNLKNAKPKQYREIYPLALLGILIPLFHWKTYILAKNSSDELVKENETVREVIRSAKRRRRFQFPYKYDLWNLYKSANVKSLSKNQKEELEECIDILTKAQAIKIIPGQRDIMVINPTLIYVSLHVKCDEDWQEMIKDLFYLTAE